MHVYESMTEALVASHPYQCVGQKALCTGQHDRLPADNSRQCWFFAASMVTAAMREHCWAALACFDAASA